MHFSDLGLEATHASGKIRDDLHKVTNVISKAHDDGSNVSKTGVVVGKLGILAEEDGAAELDLSFALGTGKGSS